MKNLLLLLKIDLLRLIKGKKEKKSSIIFKIAVTLFCAVFGFFIIGMYEFMLLDFLKMANIKEMFFPIINIFLTLMIFIYTLPKAKSYIFAQDDMLFAMPVKPSTVLLSKVISVIFINTLTVLIAFVPAIVLFGIYAAPPMVFYVFAILSIGIVAIIPTVLSLIVGQIIGYITMKLNLKRGLESLFNIVFALGLMYFFMNIQQIGASITSNPGIVGNLLSKLGFTIEAFNKTFIDYNGWQFLLLIATSIASMLVYCFIFKKMYFTVIQGMKNERVSKRYVSKELKTNSVTAALIKKEAKNYFGTSILVVNSIFGIIMLVLATVSTFFFNINDIMSVAIQAGETIDITGIIFPILVVLFAFTISTVNSCATSISLEGKRLWLLKTLPIQAKTILQSKILFNLLLILPISIVCAIIFFFTLNLTIIELIALIGFTTLYAAMISMFGLLVNLKFPKFDYASEVQVVKQSMSSFISMLVPIYGVMILAFVAFIVSDFMSVTMYIAILTAIFAVFTLIEYLLLKTWAIKKFKRLEA